jgi:hypothetical protein
LSDVRVEIPLKTPLLFSSFLIYLYLWQSRAAAASITLGGRARAFCASPQKRTRTSAVFVLMSVVPFVNSNFLAAAARRTS